MGYVCYTIFVILCFDGMLGHTRIETEDIMDNNIERWYSLKEVMEHLGVSRDTIKKWIETKNMPVSKMGKQFKFKLSEVDAWLKEGNAAD